MPAMMEQAAAHPYSPAGAGATELAGAEGTFLSTDPPMSAMSALCQPCSWKLLHTLGENQHSLTFAMQQNPQEKVVEILMTAIPEACKILLTFLSKHRQQQHLQPEQVLQPGTLTHSGLPLIHKQAWGRGRAPGP